MPTEKDLKYMKTKLDITAYVLCLSPVKLFVLTTDFLQEVKEKIYATGLLVNAHCIFSEGTC